MALQNLYSSYRVHAIAPTESRHSKARMENTWSDFGGRVIQSSGREGGTGREYLGWWGWEEEVSEGGAEMGLGRGCGLGGVVCCYKVRISLYQVRHYIISYLPHFESK